MFSVLLLPVSDAAAQLRAAVYVGGLASPVGFVQDPSDPSVQYVVEQGGAIVVIKDGVKLNTPFLDLSDRIITGGERGLVGLAFPPDYGASGRFYVYFTRAGDGHSVVARINRSADPLVADVNTIKELVWSADPDPDEPDSTPQPFIPQPFEEHKAGCMMFGPDGFLYIALGDGGDSNDPLNNAQNTTELLGKILRIDVNVPDDNEQGFVTPEGNAGLPRPEIWSLGWRNPWRFSFDDPAKGGTGAMVIADVGQEGWEEIDYEPAGRPGRNYGWRVFEGSHEHVTTEPLASPALPPVFEYDHVVGRSITGGYVYRGQSMASMRGRYFFADFITRKVWSLALTIDEATGEATASDLVDHTEDLSTDTTLGRFSSFGVDAAGELLAVSYSEGAILRIGQIPATPGGLRIIRDGQLR